jgi:hypothetical protein
MRQTDDIGARTLALRDAFDGSFAKDFESDAVAYAEYLVVRVGDRVWALRIQDVASIHVDEFVLRIPSEGRGFVGIANLRGVVVAVYDLGVLLSTKASTNSGDAPRWLLRSRNTSVVFAFDELITQARLPALANPDAMDLARGFDASVAGADVLPIAPVQKLIREIVS